MRNEECDIVTRGAIGVSGRGSPMGCSWSARGGLKVNSMAEGDAGIKGAGLVLPFVLLQPYP